MGERRRGPGLTVAVTGGCGFLGRRMVELLRSRGDEVRVLARRWDPGLDALGATLVRLDIRDTTAVQAAIADADVVFHVAAKTGSWGRRSDFWSVNVDGTRSVLRAVEAAGVPRLVYTSTASVVGYSRDVENGGPELPYATVHESAYAESKAEAERLIRAANGRRVATVALRPHLIIGPGDRRMMPRIVRRAMCRRLLIVGEGRNRVDLTDIDNAAWAHLDAAGALTGPDAPCAGKAYFISNGEPVILWEWLNQVLRQLQLPPVTRSLSFPASRIVATAVEMLWLAFPFRGEPPITRFLAAALARSHWYDLAPARRDLGYRVRVSMEEATGRVVQWIAGMLKLDPDLEGYPMDGPRSEHRAAGSPRVNSSRVHRSKERADYYIAPTRDFTQYTKDYEEKYWSKDTAFAWRQSVRENLALHLETLAAEEFRRVAMLALPLVDRALGLSIGRIEQEGLPLDEDALKAIGESLTADRGSIRQALAIQAPLEHLELPVARLKDQLAILQRQRLELREQKRLGLFRSEAGVKRLETGAERQEQTRQLSRLDDRMKQVRRALRQARRQGRDEGERLKATIRAELGAIVPQVLADLVETRALVRRSLPATALPADPERLGQLKELVVKRQMRALRDIANHALVVEQSAIAPLTMGIIHYKRRREIQEAMTTFVHDEAKHSAVFRRFMAEKMEAKERIPQAIINGSERYLWIARFMPSGAVFLAVIVEAIGGAYLEFFGQDDHMPDPLFRSICRTIAERDEKRHIELCAATYNELYRRGSRWERLRNQVALRALLKSAYGDKTEDHHLIQACRAFGYESDALYRFVAGRLSQHLTTVGMYQPWESFLEFLPQPVGQT